MWQFSNAFNVDVKFVVLDSILLLFVFIGPVILNQWFQIRVAQWTSCRHVEHHIGTWARNRHDQARVKAVLVLSILHFCHWHFLCSCGLVASLSMMLKEALCLYKRAQVVQRHFSLRVQQRTSLPWHTRVLYRFPRCFAKWYTAARNYNFCLTSGSTI